MRENRRRLNPVFTEYTGVSEMQVRAQLTATVDRHRQTEQCGGNVCQQQSDPRRTRILPRESSARSIFLPGTGHRTASLEYLHSHR